jgi:pilus assembly protein CpaB
MGAVAAYMASNWIATHADRPEKSGTIVVAAMPLGYGTALNCENVTEIPWPAGQVPEGAYATRNELFENGRRVALVPMQWNELVLKTKITGAGRRGPSLSALLAERKRAVNVRVDDVREVVTPKVPSEWVDVVLSSREYVSEVVPQDVKVLAIDQLVSARRTPTVAKVVTLELDTDQAQKVLLATNVGKLSLIPRGVADQPNRDQSGHRAASGSRGPSARQARPHRRARADHRDCDRRACRA